MNNILKEAWKTALARGMCRGMTREQILSHKKSFFMGMAVTFSTIHKMADQEQDVFTKMFAHLENSLVEIMDELYPQEPGHAETTH